MYKMQRQQDHTPEYCSLARAIPQHHANNWRAACGRFPTPQDGDAGRTMVPRLEQRLAPRYYMYYRRCKTLNHIPER